MGHGSLHDQAGLRMILSTQHNSNIPSHVARSGSRFDMWIYIPYLAVRLIQEKTISGIFTWKTEKDNVNWMFPAKKQILQETC